MQSSARYKQVGLKTNPGYAFYQTTTQIVEAHKLILWFDVKTFAVAVAEWSKAPDKELRSKAAGSIMSCDSNFSIQDCKKINKTPGLIVICTITEYIMAKITYFTSDLSKQVEEL